MICVKIGLLRGIIQAVSHFFVIGINIEFEVEQAMLFKFKA